MYDKLQHDKQNQNLILQQILEQATQHLDDRKEDFVAPIFRGGDFKSLPQQGIGAMEAIAMFNKEYKHSLSATSGPRYFGFVIGGATPASLAGDWLTSLYDQNSFGIEGHVDRHIEQESIEFLKQLMDLDKDWFGVFCSGATMANVTGLSVARQWYGEKLGINIGQQGLYKLQQINVASGCAHASIYKGFSILGMGRNTITKIPCIDGREAIDIHKLEQYLKSKKDQPVIVIANIGTANSGDYDNLIDIVKLKKEYGFYLHVDAAIIGISAVSEKYKYILDGINQCDSVTIDGHKWLNVPYDSAVILTKNPTLQYKALVQAEQDSNTDISHQPLYNFVPEGSRRMRALPMWLSMMAYGKEGYEHIVNTNCQLATMMGELMAGEKYFKILNDIRLNIICYTINVENSTPELIQNYTNILRSKGITYSNTTNYNGIPAIRICVSNWLTTEDDIKKSFQSMVESVKEALANN